MAYTGGGEILTIVQIANIIEPFVVLLTVCLAVIAFTLGKKKYILTRLVFTIASICFAFNLIVIGLWHFFNHPEFGTTTIVWTFIFGLICIVGGIGSFIYEEFLKRLKRR